nr:TonB-dependent receptor [Gemmatimonadaceae bacterium]
MSSRLYTVAMLLLVLAAPLAAQSSAGGIRGQVTAADERPVEGMTVTAVRPDGSFLRRTVTDAAGTFLVGALPAGEYEVTVQRVGFRRTVVRGVLVGAGRTTELAITVAATAVELAPIVVEAGGVTIERGSPQFETTLNERAITRLPTGVDAQRLVALTPGVRADQLWGGSSVQSNNYQLNGISANHPGLGGALVSPNVSWIEQLEVRGLGAGAEHGNFQGGIVNVVTKTGSNTLQGHVRTALETHQLNGSNLTRTEDVPELASRNEVEGEVRGPLVRDRLFYYVSGQLIRSDRRAVNHLQVGESQFAPDMERTDEVRALLRATFNPTTSDLLNASAGMTGAYTDQFGLTGREVPGATQRRSAPMHFYDVSWERRLGRFGFLEAKGAHMRGRDDRRPYEADSVPGIATYQVSTTRQFQNAVFTDLQRPTNTVGSLIWRSFATTGPVEHNLTVGAEDGAGTWQHRRTRNGGMTWRPRYYPPVVNLRFDPADPRTWDPMVPTAWGGEIDIDTWARNSAAFVQDNITWGRLTLTPGVRFGWWEGRMRDTAGLMIRALRTQGVDPRIGFVLDLSGVGLPFD